MFRDVVLQDTRPEEWPALRERLLARVLSSMGTFPEVTVRPEFEILEEYENYGLKHQKVRFEVLPGEYCPAIMVLPRDISPANPAPAVVVCHGTNRPHGKHSMVTREGERYRAYAIDLAERGFVAVAADTFKFGEWLIGGKEFAAEELDTLYRQEMDAFAEGSPEWSLDGRRLWDHQRLLDVLDTLPIIQPKSYGVTGNSLGGRTTIFLSAFDERIGASAPSTGVSPNLTNIYRAGQGPALWRAPAAAPQELRAGHMLYDYQDMIALNAPRPLLILEPYNDAYNPFMDANFKCYVRGQRVYALLGKPECFCTLTHGDGHGMPPDVREFAYRWFARWLRNEA